MNSRADLEDAFNKILLGNFRERKAGIEKYWCASPGLVHRPHGDARVRTGAGVELRLRVCWGSRAPKAQFWHFSFKAFTREDAWGAHLEGGLCCSVGSRLSVRRSTPRRRTLRGLPAMEVQPRARRPRHRLPQSRWGIPTTTDRCSARHQLYLY